MAQKQPFLDTSPKVSDEIRQTTCYMCACRCGINVHLRDGTVSYIEGNRDHPVNKGVICGKGASGIMQHYSPARLRAPMKRVGPRGSGQFEEISWGEALELATGWLGKVRKTDPKKLAFFTGRDQSQSLTGLWAMKYGTPNFAAHGGFCSVNMAAGGLYTFGGAFWEFGDPDWDYTKYFMLFGVAEDHASNPIKKGIGKIKKRGAKFVSVNPVRTGYNAVADEWVGIRPGTDALFVGALIHELFRAQQIDLDYLIRYTNSPWLVIQDPGAADHGLFARDAEGNPLVWSNEAAGFGSGKISDLSASLTGTRTLPDGRAARTVFELMAERYLGDEYAPEAVEERTGVPATQIRKIAAELAHVAFKEEVIIEREWTDAWGRKHDKLIGRPISMHAMRGISAHSNGFQTCRMIHILQILLGSIDCPGGFRYKPPYPKQTPPNLLPHGAAGDIKPEMPLGGPHLGFPHGPHHLLLDEEGGPNRLDKGFSWDAPMSAHGLMHMVINNAAEKDPYGIDVLFMYMANMAWNSSMNTPGTIDALTKTDENGDYVIPKIIYSDAYYSETVSFADLILPDTTYLERYDCISLLDRPISEPEILADSIRYPVVEPDRDVRGFQTVLIDLGARLGLPGFVDDEGAPLYPGGYPDYIVNHERKPGIGPLAGFRGKDGSDYGVGEKNPDQLKRYIENGSFWEHRIDPEHAYFRHANRGYLDWGIEKGIRLTPEATIFQLYSEPVQRFRLAAKGHGDRQPPERARERIEKHFDPLPFWYPPLEESMVDAQTFPLHAITQRPMHMYHSWGSQNAWLRQITAANRLYIHTSVGESIGAKDDDWVWLSSHQGRVKCQVRLMDGVNPHTVWTWNAIGKRRGAWGLSDDAPESNQGFLLNHLISELLPEGGGGYRYSNSDPITGQAAWFDLKVSIEKADGDARTEPFFEPVGSGSQPPSPKKVAFGAEFGSKDK
ncbi:Tetrathionate reductase subunit A precursor [Tritonibacter multivorans]|uniref:Tetrathionate reductase subunit A n=1 Tax=Tritonibacter multivorans TaxID=928856 RepID=A0A0P1G9L3_9RHOB|nr:molybdopterin oxidoreductase family protein [Tritonibacter multivorans]MDA7422872.1 molybdopterin oxidoreductase family protein [Tritonibacter multivorans]CUH78240.1 Tetrathionate reductase subunit A precursor [Tritonibacter multivorans]SFD62638.1 Molydopterin dinucleotide binding domain-containing protein [Tritonibacter multivorans]